MSTLLCYDSSRWRYYDMKKEIAVLIASEYADWEMGYILPKLNNENYHVTIVGVDALTLQSVGGLQVTSDCILSDYVTKVTSGLHVDMLLVCGGDFWGKQGFILPELVTLLDAGIAQGALIGAICDGTTFLANNGYLDKVAHTTNSLDYTKAVCPNYKGSAYAQEQPCVVDGNLITADGASPLEFTKAILMYLEPHNKENIEHWYAFHKHHIWHDSLMGA